MSIRSIQHRGLRRLYKTGSGRDLPSSMVEKLSDILLAIEEAAHPDEVGLFPGWRLHPLKGELKGFWSVSMSGNWRIIFRFEEGDAFDLDFVDYH